MRGDAYADVGRVCALAQENGGVPVPRFRGRVDARLRTSKRDGCRAYTTTPAIKMRDESELQGVLLEYTESLNAKFGDIDREISIYQVRRLNQSAPLHRSSCTVRVHRGADAPEIPGRLKNTKQPKTRFCRASRMVI